MTFASCIPLVALPFIVGTLVGQLAQAPPGASPSAASPSPESVKKAELVIAEARKALGGMDRVKTLVASGRTKRVRGNNLVPIEFEMFFEPPSRYVRVDEFPAEDTDPTSAGFNGDALIQNPPPPAMPPTAVGRGGPGQAASAPGAASAAGAAGAAPRPAEAVPPSRGVPSTGAAAPGGPGAGGTGALPAGGMAAAGRGPTMDPRRARLQTVKQDYARFALGLFADSPAYPLTYAYEAVAEAPQGRADVLDVRGEGNFSARLFIHSDTRLPIMVAWTTPPTSVIVTVPGQPPPATVAPGAVVVPGPPAPPKDAPPEEMDKYSKAVLAIRAKAQATPVENRLYFADYRDVDGLKLPFRLRRAIGAETTEETTFDRYRVNVKVDPRKFETIK